MTLPEENALVRWYPMLFRARSCRRDHNPLARRADLPQASRGSACSGRRSCGYRLGHCRLVAHSDPLLDFNPEGFPFAGRFRATFSPAMP